MVPGLSRRSVAGLILCCLVALCCFAAPAFSETFQNPPIVSTSPDPLGLATADLNHDGKADLVYVNGSQYGQQALHVLLGNGDGTFTHEQDILLPAGVCCTITIADVTGDGIPDIIMEGNRTTTAVVAVMVGNGDGTFQAPVVSTYQTNNSGVYPRFGSAIGVGDINGDGNADLALPNAGDSEVDLLLGDGTGKFTFSSSLSSYTRNAVYLTDLNGDGHLDIVATDITGAVFYVYLGNGDGTFQNPVRYSDGTASSAFILTDVDGDGHPDMLTQYYPGDVGYFKGNADGSFDAMAPIGSANSSDPLIGADDFNADGVPDLLFTSVTGIGVESSSASLAYTAMKLTVSGRTPALPATPIPPVVADFNGDGHLDLAVPVEGGIAILFGKGDGTFASVPFYDMGQEVGAVAVADFNGDGHPDIAVTLPAALPRLLLGDGTGSFTLGPDPNASYAASGADVTAVTADFNGDGKADLDIGNMAPDSSTIVTQSIALGNGDGTFSTPVSVPNSSPVVADVNGDGRSDMISASGQNIIVSLGQADGSFTTVTTPLLLPSGLGFFQVGDVNNDGKPDLVLLYSDHLEVWLGNGDGSFTYHNSEPLQGTSGDLVDAVTDMDGDGNADIVLTPSDYANTPITPVTILYGNGDGTFQPPVYVPTTRRYSQVVVADVNGDNLPDLVMTDGSGIAVMLNLGGRKFGPEEEYIGGASISALSVKDVNGDGFPDIVAANTGGTTVTVLLNEPNGVSPEGAAVNGTLALAPAAPVGGQPITFSLAVSGQTAGAAVPTGTVSFYIDGGFQATEPVTNGTATYNAPGTLIPIQHTVVATYNGDSVYAPRSFTAVFSIAPPTYATSTTLTAVPATLLASQTVRLTATVSSSVAVPAAKVTFLDGSQVIGATMMNSNQVAYFDTALLGAGVHSLSAKFNGDEKTADNGGTQYVAANFLPSTSTAVSVTVNANATATSLSASATSITSGAVETFTAQVNSSGGTPFGSASFFDGTKLLGTMALDANATASFSTASLSAGTHSIVATFNANGPFGASNSLPLSITVTSPSTAVQAVVVSLNLGTDPTSGQSTLAAMASTPGGPARGVVTFLDDGRILGRVETDAEGKAILAIGTLASGVHDFTASFSGGPAYATAASPEMHERWPATGPGFSVSPSAGVLDLSASKPAKIQIGVAPLAGFRETVQLSCIGGLPTGYTCSFSPASLKGGASRLTIASANRTAAVPLVRMPSYWLLLALALLGWLAAAGWALAAEARPRRLRRAVLLMAACCAIGALAGCAARFSSSSERILTIQAKSGSGADAVVHSTQVTLRIH